MHKATDTLLVRLLCVEDDDDDWVDLQTALSLAKSYAEFDISWHRCKSMHQANTEIKERDVDVILLDLKLVDSPNPLETTRSVSEVAGPLGIPIVILSGLRDDAVLTRECSLAGAYHHLQKGRYDALDLLSAIRLSYLRNQELQRQRDLFLDAQRAATENLALAEQATGILAGLRSDLRNFAKNDRNRRMFYSALITGFLFIGMPSLEANALKVKASNESLGLLVSGLWFIWGQGSFQERLRQSSESAALVDEILNRKKGD